MPPSRTRRSCAPSSPFSGWRRAPTSRPARVPPYRRWRVARPTPSSARSTPRCAECSSSAARGFLESACAGRASSTTGAEVSTDHFGVGRGRLLEPVAPPVLAAERAGRALRDGIPPRLGKGRMAVAVLRIENTRKREHLQRLPHCLPQVLDVLELKIQCPLWYRRCHGPRS